LSRDERPDGSLPDAARGVGTPEQAARRRRIMEAA